MADYIRRDIVLKIINTVNDTGGFAGYADYCVLFDEIDTMPASDVQPIKRAKWILFDKDCCGRAFYCSNCHKVTTTDDFENTPLEREEYFCPRCGADMRNK